MPGSVPHTIIGIDSAVKPKNTGLALMVKDHKWVIKEVRKGSTSEPAIQIINEWLRTQSQPALLAIDAPLGWPLEMSLHLPEHRAGEYINTSANKLFRRYTDVFLYEKLRKMPLEIGAERIARTALKTLEILNDIRKLNHIPLPLAWSHESGQTAAIEVYPAGTLLANNIPIRKYKNDDPEGPYRTPVLNFICNFLKNENQMKQVAKDTDMLDAVLCCIAGVDFLANQCHQPPVKHLSQIKKEGWIWFRDLNTNSTLNISNRNG